MTLIAAAAGCGDNGPSTGETTGSIQISVPASPGDVTSIHVAVTGADFLGPIGTDLTLTAGVWTGTVIDVPPGPARTVTAEGFDVDLNNTFEGIANNVTVFAGKLTDVQLVLKPKDNGPFPVANTPPNFVNVIHPPETLSTEPVTFFAIADDPDSNTELTYVWSVLSGGGSFSSTTQSNQIPGIPVSTLYTPMSGFTGFAVIQVSVTDGIATTITTFPLAVGAGLIPNISFDVLPDLEVSSIERQMLMPGGTTQVNFGLTNPVQPWTPATMHIHTEWSDSCGGQFDAAPEDIDINQGNTTTRTVTYTAPPGQPPGVTLCQLTLTVVDAASVEMTFTLNVWINPPMVMFVSSVAVAGNSFNGQWQVADAFCQNLADAQTASVPTGTYQALVSFDEINAKDRLIDAPYIRIDGSPIARNKAELFSLDLLNSIRNNENNAFNGVSAVFTGTNANGTKAQNCNNWTSNSGSVTGTEGLNAASASPTWTNAGSFSCSSQLPIYCVQQPEVQLP